MNGRRFHVLVPQQLLHGANVIVIPRLQELCGEAMPEGLERFSFVEGSDIGDPF